MSKPYADDLISILTDLNISEDPVANKHIHNLAKEVQRLRNLAPWHSTERVKIIENGPRFELEGHLIDEIDGCGVIKLDYDQGEIMLKKSDYVIIQESEHAPRPDH